MRVLLFLFFAFPTLASAQSLPDLSWLKGCWRLQQGDTVITEVWSAPPMGVMLGYAYTMRGGVLTEWEQTRIQIADGVPTYMAMPGGRAQTPFAMVASGPRMIAFANPAHDFPQRVEYARDGDRLTARVSAGEDVIEFPYRRISCASALRP